MYIIGECCNHINTSDIEKIYIKEKTRVSNVIDRPDITYYSIVIEIESNKDYYYSFFNERNKELIEKIYKYFIKAFQQAIKKEKVLGYEQFININSIKDKAEKEMEKEK